jgi:type I restriction enzyme S subunit
MVRVTDIKRGFLDLSGTLKVHYKVYQEFIRRRKPRAGDILLTRVGVYFGISCYVDRNQDFCLGQNTVCIASDRQKIIPYFSYCCLNAPSAKQQMDSLVGGGAQPTISLRNISLLRIPLPDLAIQRKIAAILWAYDNLIENNLQRIKILEEMAQHLYREWFVKFRFPGYERARFTDSPLGMIPEGWEVKRLDQVVLSQNNGTKAGEHLSDRVYLPIDCIPRRSLAISEISSWKEAQSSLHLFDKGDILFGAMRPYFHKVVVAPFKGVTRKTCFVFKSVLSEYHAFTALTLFQDSTVSFANAHSKGSTIPYAVWLQSMDGMPVVVPSIELAKRFEETVGPMITRIGTAFFQNAALHRTRDLLLPKLVSGEEDVSELDITVPEEESEP